MIRVFRVVMLDDSDQELHVLIIICIIYSCACNNDN